MMAAASPAGRIITFYSYKGGTGRSMALANIAWILASNGRRVLVIDWDLEAPGLHRYFHPFLSDKELTHSKGLIDFLIDFVAAAVTAPSSSDSGAGAEWYMPYANILRYATSLNYHFPLPGSIDFVPAGRQDDGYALRINSFHWEQFYSKLGGGMFLEAVKETVRQEYDYILIDSRTGVSDTAGICTVQMPDDLVVCFTLNVQSIEGTAAVAKSAFVQRRKPDGSPGTRVWPIPMRVEAFEKEKLDLAREATRERFDLFVSAAGVRDEERYWGSVEVPYQPFYAYEEVLAALADKPNQAASLLGAMERITAYVTEGSVRAISPIPDAERQQILRLYSRQVARKTADRGTPASRYTFFLAVAPEDWETTIANFSRDLLTAIGRKAGRTNARAYVPDYSDMKDELWLERSGRALEQSDIMVVLLSQAYLNHEHLMGRLSSFRLRFRPIIPLVWKQPSRLGSPEFIDLINLGAGYLAPYGVQDLHSLVTAVNRAGRPAEYEAFLEDFAGRIVEARESQVSAEEHTGESCIITVLAARKDEMRALHGNVDGYADSAENWRPFPRQNRWPAQQIIREVAWSRYVPLRTVPFDELPASAPSESAAALGMNATGEVIVIVDLQSILLESYRAILRQIVTTNSASVVCCVDGPPSDSRAVELLAELTDSDVPMATSRYFAYDLPTLRVVLSDAVAAFLQNRWRSSLLGSQWSR